MIYLKRVLCLFSIVILSSCAVGPLVSHETARTVGNSNHELIGGYGMTGFVAKWSYGVFRDLDLGIHLESLSAGVRLKYALVNQNDGLSIALAGGIGKSVGGKHHYGDLIISYLAGSFEPYGLARIVKVYTDPVEFKDEDTGDIKFTFTEDEYTYGQGILGFRYWLTQGLIFSVEAGSLYAISSHLSIDANIFVGAALGYRFGVSK